MPKHRVWICIVTVIYHFLGQISRFEISKKNQSYILHLFIATAALMWLQSYYKIDV